ncbi:gas vesicle protein GvpJ [Sinomonas terrae]|uniref:Gas vesicle protein A n=1 Tax=Sinomonas terrae TaxID=2908838 RepID=A0ABS9U4M3_9MICC|nr:gas vesicle protein GvpJ [Sinomonas terrae]MCH6471540.1 gas vesicle protein [Sinomonas terrae]
MTVSQYQPRAGYLERPQSSSLAEVLNVILDKGLVIDAYVRLSLVGIEVLTVDLRAVMASIDTYLRFAEAAGRLEIDSRGGRGLPEMLDSRRDDGDGSSERRSREQHRDGPQPERSRPREAGARRREG